MQQPSELQGFCLQYLGKLMGKPASDLNPDADFASLGLDSATAVALIFELEEKLQIDLAPSLMFEYPSVSRLVAHLSGLIGKKAS